MACLLERHPLFTPFTDPVSGVVSFLLKNGVAPVQQSLYYTQPSLSADGKWLWFHAAHPPAPSKHLAAVRLDPDRPEVRVFPQAQFPTAHPVIEAAGSVLFGAGPVVWRLDLEGKTTKVFELPPDYLAGRELKRLATHLTLSADGRNLLLDGQAGNQWFVGTADLATGEFRLIQEFMAHHNHAQFSPVDPELFLIAHDQYRDPVSGRFVHHLQRVFLMNTAGTRYEWITPDHLSAPFRGACHEWWSRDGWVCYLDYELGVYEYDPRTGERNHVWREPVCHAHCSADRRFWCADESPYKWRDKPCEVLFFDRQTGKRTAIQSGMAAPGGDYWATRATYHIDPHPQFSPDDQWIIYTSTVENRVTVALTPVSML